MAKTKTTRKARAVTREPGSIRFSRVNWILMGLGVTCLIAGYALLARGSTVAAPLLLVLGYVVFLPLGIIR